VPSPKRSASPRATSTHCNVDSLKVLDPERPIREADVEARRFWIARKPETHLFSTAACSMALL
jgi:hypothetical protein